MKNTARLKNKITELNALLEDILTDCYNEEEQLWSIREYFEDEITFPIDAHVIGEPVSVTEINYDGNKISITF